MEFLKSKSMKHTLSLILIFHFVQNYAQDAAIAYIDAFAPIAIQEMERSGIPASIKLAQALLESNYGRSEMAMNANNHFGIKCGGDWKGQSYFREDDDKDHRGRIIESCFRVYSNPEESFMAHSDFLRNNGKSSRYDFLFDYDPRDYKKWAHGLKKAGYATDPNYSKKLINLIEKYELYTFDDMGSNHPDYVSFEPANQKRDQQESRILNDKNVNADFVNNNIPEDKYYNGVRVYLTNGNESIQDISELYGVDVAALMKYNDNIDSPYATLNPKSRVYLEKKNLSFQGKKKFHEVRQGEFMAEIAQHYAIDLEALYIRNRMPFGSEPVPGELIQLKGLLRTGKKPEIRKKKNTSLADKSRFVEETVEYIFTPKHADKK